ncbi:imidazole glycerol phosphate synthase subunit HisH [Candidatus Aerophobetes bacterium]|nr:imidazole glycerol phosphate synthase subunit HisH [Candidatus Aerophobetes bacterium]
MIAIIDYGMGNLRSVENAFKSIGYPVTITRDPGKILDSSGIILPGVGAFRDCLKNLKTYGLFKPLYKFIESKKPFLGICLGLQVFFEESEEFGRYKGLGILKGRVVSLPQNRVKIPHMGWNTIKIRKKCPIFEGIKDFSYFYFVHSYYVIPEEEEIIATTTDYGVEFTSSIWKDNIFACQFHPEKSQKLGLKVLKKFGEICQRNAG